MKEKKKEPAVEQLLDGLKLVTVGLGSLASSIAPFVAALNPALMGMFNDALQNVYATIGQAFLPIITEAIGYLQEVAGILNPLARELAPVMQKLATAFFSLLTPILQLVVAIAQSLMPVINILASILQVWADIQQVQIQLLRVFVDQIIAFIGSIVGGIKGGDIVNLFQQLGKATVLVIGQFLHFLGATQTLGSLIENLQNSTKLDTVRNRAPQDIGIRGFQDQLNSIQTAALGAGGGATKGQDEYMQDIIHELQDIKNGNGDKWEKIIETAVTKALASLKKDGIEAAGNSVKKNGIDLLIPGLPIARSVLNLGN